MFWVGLFSYVHHFVSEFEQVLLKMYDVNELRQNPIKRPLYFMMHYMILLCIIKGDNSNSISSWTRKVATKIAIWT